MVHGKGTSKPYISFLGNSSADVTGSMHLIRFKKYEILLDCGLIQLSDIATSYKANAEQLKKVKPNEVDYIILSHCHIDHSGLIPAMFARGCHAHVYIPKGSLQILKLLWTDSLKIMQSDCAKLTRHGIKANPFYEEKDIYKAITRCVEVDFLESYTISEDIEFTYYPAGHIINSAQVYLVLKDGFVWKRIGYTGDIGGDNDRCYVRHRATLPFVDILIGENTYNIPTRPNKPKDRFNDLEKLKAVINSDNKILIPIFALNRCQELLTVLFKLWVNGDIDDIPIYLDSPLALKLCNIWETEDIATWNKVWTWKNLHIISSWEESVVLQNVNQHCIILSASGFLAGGRVLAHLKTILPNPKNHILFVGYAGENNLASQIKDNQKEVIVDGDIVQNNANITELRSFSSHASYEELIDYYANKVRCNKIALVHGDIRYKPEFCNVLQNQLIKQGSSARVVCINKNQKIYF